LILNFILEMATKMGIFYTIMYLTGLLVLKKGIKVNYTRKINHFALLAVPFLLGLIFGKGDGSSTGANDYVMLIIGLLSGLLFFVIFIEPIRKRVSVFNTVFAGIDRPEDRPFTLKWTASQTAANYLVAIPVAIYLSIIDRPELIFIIILINGIGDGLAEPIGIRFGKHKYQTYALLTKKKYVRSIEGSACVFIVSLLVILLFSASFSTMQFIVALVSFPLIMTLAEAKAPHTWDNPFLFAIGGILLFLIFQFFS